jgi:hypothetical protein
MPGELIMSDIIKIEALIASPPTTKCQETMDILEWIVRSHPDKIRLVVYKRGIDMFPDDATGGMKTMFQKGSPVPTVVVNGMFFSANQVPHQDELEARVQQVLVNTGAQ